MHHQLLHVLHVFLGHAQLADQPVEWEQLLELARAQGVAGIAAHVAQSDPHLSDDLRRRCYGIELAIIQRSCEQDYAFDQLAGLLEKKSIPYLPVKGRCIREAYPVPELREMGDCDIVVHPQDHNRIKEVFDALGYQLELNDGFETTYVRQSISYEMHETLFAPILSRDPDKFTPMLSVALWDKAHAVEDTSCHRFSCSDEAVLMILHMVSHFYGNTCGIRFFLDLAVYFTHFADQLDWAYMQQQLDQFGFGQFFKVILSMTQKWFALAVPFSLEPVQDEIQQRLEKMVFGRGLFGHADENNALAMRARHAAWQRDKDRGHMLYFSRAHLEEEYPYLRKCALFYPIAWTQKVVGLFCTFKRQNHKTLFQMIQLLPHISKYKAAGNEEVDLLQKIGL